MNSTTLTRASTISIILMGLVALLSACNLITSGGAEPPRPTIVPVASTDTPQPTATVTAMPSPTATAVVETQQTESNADENQADDVASDTIPASQEPTPTDTVAATSTPTEIPPTATVASSPTPAPTQLPPLNSIELRLVPFAGGFTKPVYLTHSGDGSGRLFVVEQAGRILILNNGNTSPTPFLDIISRVGSDGLEQGLLSIAFHPNYSNNGFFFANYTNLQGDTVISRFQRSDNPDVADPNSEKILMTIRQPYANHNGGYIDFGPNGYLYIGMGDGGAANDPENRAQNLGTLLGKILRIDVNNGDPYGVPETNPFVNDPQARPEIWSYGWRNPWRFAFDQATNDLYVADVGQNQYEEVHVQWAGVSGQNFGWRLMEGTSCFNPAQCDPAALGVELPVAEYDHSLGCSITGGYVYRGRQFPAFNGIYFYGDYCTGFVWGLRYEPDGSWSQTQFLQTDAQISSFGQDENGEIYLLDHGGNILLLSN